MLMSIYEISRHLLHNGDGHEWNRKEREKTSVPVCHSFLFWRCFEYQPLWNLCALLVNLHESVQQKPLSVFHYHAWSFILCTSGTRSVFFQDPQQRFESSPRSPLWRIERYNTARILASAATRRNRIHNCTNGEGSCLQPKKKWYHMCSIQSHKSSRGSTHDI